MNEKIRQLAAAAVTAATATKNKYFSSSRKGENFELKADLNSDRSSRKKDAVKRVIANMTIGKDVSSLFADVLKCMQTEDLELKKLVYLYLMNYAKSQPELVILAVNTFCKDTEDPNPLVRALALRTMGCIRVERIIDYLCEPLRKGLGDPNPYVRKTAAITVAKLYDLSPALAQDNGFITKLHDLISDTNPTVAANAIAALSEINEKMGSNQIFTVSSVNLSKLLASLNECTEWGQITVLDAIAIYVPLNESEAEMVIDKTIPRLQHINPAVVLSAIRVLMVYMDRVPTHPELVVSVTKKMIPPLVTLLTSHYEIQYVVLRNIKLILQKYPELLKNELKVFFCKYNDPIYVKLEKLDLTVLLANELNADQILSELKEYAKEIDIEFSTKSVRAIGQTAYHVPSCINKTTLILMDLVNTKVDHIVQECVIVIRDLLRKFGNLSLIDIPVLFTQLELIVEPDAKSALIWILGEYCHLLENAPNLLAHFMEYFIEESIQIQYHILTAAVKLYLRMPSIAHDAVHQLLQKTTSLCDNADVRDKAFIYWRLLSCDPKFAKSVILANKLPFEGAAATYDTELLQKLLSHISTLSSVYHMPEDQMEKAPVLPIPDLHLDYLPHRSSSPPAFESLPDGIRIENILDLDLDFGSPTKAFPSSSLPPSKHKDIDLLSGDIDFSSFSSSSTNVPTPAQMKTEPSSQTSAKPMTHNIAKKTELRRNESPDSVLDLL